MTAPTPPAERAPLPDALRGLALGGILLVNLQNFAGYLPWDQAGPDRTAQVLVDFFANGKWVSTFAVLFGAGVAVAVARSGWRVQVRRLLALLLIGVLHGALIWMGDILANYALVALVLVPLLFAPAALRAALAGLAFVWTALTIAGLAGLAAFAGADPGDAGTNLAYGFRDFGAVARARLADFAENLSGGVFFFGPWLFGLFVLGVGLARSGVLTEPRRFARPLWITAGVSLAIGTLLNLAFVRLDLTPTFGAQTWGTLFRLTGGLAFALLYGSLAALLVAFGRGALLAPFAAVGRLALSNYLLQSVVCTFVFYGPGLGQYGKWGALSCLAFGLALFAVQIALSVLYLRRFSRGPAEGLLRALTYGPRRKVNA